MVVAADHEEEVAGRLWLAGTLGVESRLAGEKVRLEAWFDGPDVPDPHAWLGPGVDDAWVEPVAAADWLAAYREKAMPFVVGEHFFVDPREPGDPPSEMPAGRWLLRLPARTAFGTGSHESTRLALELLEDTPVARRTVLDIGAGTGILSFAALLLGAASVVALDLDREAAVAVRDNRLLNTDALGDGRLGLFAGEIHALSSAARFDVVLQNVIPEEIWASLPRVVDHLAPDGWLIFSGILAERGKAVRDELARLGLLLDAERAAGEWVAFRFRR